MHTTNTKMNGKYLLPPPKTHKWFLGTIISRLVHIETTAYQYIHMKQLNNP